MRLIPDNAWAIATLWMEARGEPYEGKLAVAEVIRNRAARKYQSDGSIAGTVLHPLAFSCWNTGDPNRAKGAALDDVDSVVRECAQAWAEALGGSQTVRGAVLYCTVALIPKPLWASLDRLVATVGRQNFYLDPL